MILLVGVALVAIGAIVWGLGRLGFTGLPGDLAWETGNMKIYAPIVTCLVLSVVISLGIWLVRLFLR
jgi:hypothetical protein